MDVKPSLGQTNLAEIAAKPVNMRPIFKSLVRMAQKFITPAGTDSDLQSMLPDNFDLAPERSYKAVSPPDDESPRRTDRFDGPKGNIPGESAKFYSSDASAR